MNKIYAFLVIIPFVVILFLKSLSFYEFDTKQRYIKNAVDGVAHKVMITGVMTVSDEDELLKKLSILGNFKTGNMSIKYGNLQSDGSIAELGDYSLGNVLDRGDFFSIYVESENESNFSRMEDNSADEANGLHYRAKATCRIEKKSQAD